MQSRTSYVGPIPDMWTAVRRAIPGSTRPQRAAGTGAGAGLAPQQQPSSSLLCQTSTLLGENIATTSAATRTKFGAQLLPIVNGTLKQNRQVRSLSLPSLGLANTEWAAISTGRAAAVQSGPAVVVGAVESPNRFGGSRALSNNHHTAARSYSMGRTSCSSLGGSRAAGECRGASSAGGSSSVGSATVSYEGAVVCNDFVCSTGLSVFGDHYFLVYHVTFGNRTCVHKQTYSHFYFTFHHSRIANGLDYRAL